MCWVPSNGKIRSKKENFLSFLTHKYDCNGYKMARFRAFLYHPDTHSWFFNFYDNCTNTFPIWFYYWWTWLGCFTSIFPNEAKEGWEDWNKSTPTIELYTKEVQSFWTFNISWIFSWEYRFYTYLLNTSPLLVVHIYKLKWWNGYKTKLCGNENVEFFYKTKTKKFTLHKINTFDKEVATGPSTPIKKESPLASTKARSKGLIQKEIEILELLKDDPAMRQVFL